MKEPIKLYDDKYVCFNCGDKFEEEQLSDDYLDINLCLECAQKELEG